MTQSPPESAVILFDGTDLSNWTSLDGSEPSWKVEDGQMLVVPRTGDVISKETFTDHFLHIEFRCPDMPEATGQAKGNSGVFLQGRYEVQVLDSYGIAVPGYGRLRRNLQPVRTRSLTPVNLHLNGSPTMSSFVPRVSMTQVR